MSTAVSIGLFVWRFCEIDLHKSRSVQNISSRRVVGMLAGRGGGDKCVHLRVFNHIESWENAVGKLRKVLSTREE